MNKALILCGALFGLIASAKYPIFSNIGGLGTSKATPSDSLRHPTGDGSKVNASTDVARRAHFRSHDTACANIRDYGGDKTGTTSSDAALIRAIRASDSAHICVYLPAGTYLFYTAHSINLSSKTTSASVTIRGDGPDVTSLSFLQGTSGLTVSLNDASHSFHIRDLSVIGGPYRASTTGIAVVQNAIVPNPAYSAQSDISSVSIHGTDGYAQKNGFGVGISIAQASNVNFINDYVIGPASGAARCVNLAGTNDSIAVVFNFIGTVLNSCAVGLYYGPNVQGVTIVSSNMTGNRTGIYSPPRAPNLGQLSVTASQFANVDFDVNLQTDPGGTTISNSYFLANVDSTQGAARINIASSKNTSISGNVFQGISGINAVVVQNSVSAWSMFIGGNTFNQFSTAIWLQNNSQNVTAGTNSFSGNKTDILNQGKNNIIPVVSCAGIPTSRFMAINGIIVHC